MVALQPAWISAAQAAQHATRVPASVSLAQFGQESGWGVHMPAGSLNPFGVKDFTDAGASAVWAMTTEVIGRQAVRKRQPFKRYASLGDAFLEHAQLIATAPIYAPAMALLPNLPGFVVELARHYATDPDYARELLAIINGDGLTRFDAAAA